jgi:hypothetical protein
VSDQSVRLVTFIVLMVHGLGHGGGIGALAWIAWRPGSESGGWTAARSWLLPTLTSGTAGVGASAFWIISLVGFVAAALMYWFGWSDGWRILAIGSAVISMSGIVLFFGTWPMFNTLAAIGVNAAVLIGLGLLRWTPPTA